MEVTAGWRVGWTRWGWLLPPVAVGAFLRLFRLGPQLLIYDELHAPRTAMALDMAEILTSYLPSDNSIPLTALFEFLVEWGIELTELHLRLPSIIAGLLTLVAIPVAVAWRLDTRTARWAAWLTAISPGLVFYSRIARSYMPVVLLAFLAVIALEHWWRSGRLRSAAAYVASAALATWLHLVAAPFVAAPFLWAGGAKLARPRVGRSLGAIALVGLALAAGFAAFLLPAWQSFVELLAGKSGSGRPAPRVIPHVLALQAGAAEPWAVVLFWALAVVGLATLFTRRPGFAALTVVPPAANLAALLTVAPFGIVDALILNRYLLVGLPMALVWAAVGLERAAAAAEDWWARAAATGGWIGRVGGGRVAVAVAVPLLVLGGPFLDPQLLDSSFLTHDDFVDFVRPSSRPAKPELVPGFYRQLAASPGDEPIIEATSLPTWVWQSHISAAQRIHRRRVLLSPAEPGLFVPGLAFGNFVEPKPEELLAAPAGWLVLHRKSAWELDRTAKGDTIGFPLLPEMRQLSRRMARRLGGDLERRWGPPDYADEVLLVWDLERLRRERAGASNPP